MLRTINHVLSVPSKYLFNSFPGDLYYFCQWLYNAMWNLKRKPIPLHSQMLVFSSFLNNHVAFVFHNILSLKYFPCRATSMC